MGNYKTAFLIAAIAISVEMGFFLHLSIRKSSTLGMAVYGGAILICWILYFYLRSGWKGSFVVSFAMVNLVWWPLLYQTGRRVAFVIREGGMEPADGMGSPAAFLLHAALEQIFFVPLTAAMIFGILAIRASYKSRGEEPSAVLPK